MKFLELCKKRYESTASFLCVGLDPIIEKFPDKYRSGNIEKDISEYFTEIISLFSKYIAVIKPNIAFYEQYGISGYNALKKIIDYSKKIGIPVILDAKRGDIGATSLCYAKAAFDELNSDAITLSPYLGEDSLEPFFNYKDKGFFILARTSNRGSSDFQLLKTIDNEYLYNKVANKIVEWNKKYSDGIGAVAGATHLDELKEITQIFLSSDNYPPILIPGVGTQGGDLKSVINIFKELNYPLSNIFINSSSKINYAHLEHKDKSYLDAIEIEIKKMMI